MKAIQINKFGAPNELKLIDTPKPKITKGTVLIKVKAVGINPIDFKTRAGSGFLQEQDLPIILGWDVSGIIEEVSSDVTEFKPQDKVFGMINFPKAGNCYAEYIIAEPSNIVKIPDNIDFIQAAATPLAALTAWQAMFEHANVKKDDKILIHAGSGGVGHFAIQIAKAVGAFVYSTASKKNHDLLKKLGTDVCIDYRSEKFEDIVKDLSFVLDTVGGDSIIRSAKCLQQNNGSLMSIRGRGFIKEIQEAKNLGIKAEDITVYINKKDLSEIANLIEKGKITPIIDQTFDIKNSAKAHEYLETGRAKGKVVLTI